MLNDPLFQVNDPHFHVAIMRDVPIIISTIITIIITITQ